MHGGASGSGGPPERHGERTKAAIAGRLHFGRIAFVEIDALSVGRIVQAHPLDEPFERGEEKSVFRFGGSAIVVFGEPGAWCPSDDLLAHTKDGLETLVRLGEPIGFARGMTKPNDRP